MIKKCVRSNQDILMGLLILRNSPLQCGLSPAQLLMGRQLTDNLPKIHKPRSEMPQRNLHKQRLSAKFHHDTKLQITKSELFITGNKVAIQDTKTKEWSTRGTAIDQVAPRSYTVNVNGKVLRRNQSQMTKFMQSSHQHLVTYLEKGFTCKNSRTV